MPEAINPNKLKEVVEANPIRDPKDEMIRQLADQLEEAAINLSLPCNGGNVVTYKIDLVRRARELIGER